MYSCGIFDQVVACIECCNLLNCQCFEQFIQTASVYLLGGDPGAIIMLNCMITLVFTFVVGYLLTCVHLYVCMKP